LADQPCEAIELARHALVRVHHLVDGVRDAARHAGPPVRQPGREVAAAERGEDLEQLVLVEHARIAAVPATGLSRGLAGGHPWLLGPRPPSHASPLRGPHTVAVHRSPSSPLAGAAWNADTHVARSASTLRTSGSACRGG